METTTLTETGCYLDNHRGHYIIRDVIELAASFGFIIGGMERFTLERYDEYSHHDSYPIEELQELCDEAIEWLNSGQDKCGVCHGRTWVEGQSAETFAWHKVICNGCSGSGRGPRIGGQNFPLMIPTGYSWGFNDGDFGLYAEEED